MKRALLVASLALAPSLAVAQGLPSANQVFAGPATGTPSAPAFRALVPADVPVSLTLDSIGSTRGSILERGASGWQAITPGTSGLPWVSNGAGADPAYQLLTGAGISPTASVTVGDLVAGQPISYSGTILTAATTSVLSSISSITGTDNTHNAVPYNYFNVSSDSAAFSHGSGSFGALLYAVLNFGNTTATQGGRTAVQGVLTQQGRTANNGPSAGFQAFYIAGGFSVNATANDNGTGVTSTTASGAVQGLNGVAVLQTGATNFYALTGAEVDVSVATGASVYRKEGLLITQLSSDAIHGTSEGALVLGNQPGAVGWNIGIEIGNDVAGAISSTGTILACGNNCGTVGAGIDLSAFTITNCAFKSPSYCLQGTGRGIFGSTALTPQSEVETIIAGNVSGNETAGHGLQTSTGHTNSTDYTLYMGADKTNAVVYLQGVQWGTGSALLALNARGGAVVAGGSSQLSAAALSVNGTFATAGFAIVNLPSCGAGTKGAQTYVTNGQTTPTFLGTVSTTGAVVAPVFCNGTNWVYY